VPSDRDTVTSGPAAVADLEVRQLIPFNQPTIEGSELEYIRTAIEHGHSSASGPFSAQVSELLRDELGVADVLLTTSCTDALEMTALMLDLQPGDTVIVPSFTFVSTALAYARAGARLLFCDIEPRTLGLDPAHLEELLDDSVRAVATVHYAGVASDLDGLERALHGYDRVDLIEDNAHGLFGTYRDRPLGTFGRFSTLSFHETKNFVCGEGGALLLNDPEDIDRAHVLHDKGTNRRAFMLGQVDKYSWQDIGSSFGMSDLLAAFLLAQLEERKGILHKRRDVFDRYERLLSGHAERFGYRTPIVPDDRLQAYHMYYVLLPDRAQRDATLRYLGEHGVKATFHYVPLHSAPGAQAHLARPTACPVTEDISGRLLRLPFHNDLTAAQIDRVVELFLEAQEQGPTGHDG
jgi:dTDP-4-amino-4,6-dideoxygalactose transaminase